MELERSSPDLDLERSLLDLWWSLLDLSFNLKRLDPDRSLDLECLDLERSLDEGLERDLETDGIVDLCYLTEIRGKYL